MHPFEHIDMYHTISKQFPLIMETIACQGSGFMKTIIEYTLQVHRTLFGFDHSDQ